MVHRILIPMKSIPEKIYLTEQHCHQMREHVSSEDPLEACGMIGGEDWKSQEVFPARNVLQSATRYQIEPHRQIEVFNLLDERGWELISIYHSHPNGPSSPSLTDVSEATYPESVYLIWSKSDHIWDCRGFIIEAGKQTQVEIIVVPTN